MAKNKKKKKNTGVTSSIGGKFEVYRHKSEKKAPRPMTASRETVRKEIRTIVYRAREEKDALKKRISHAAKEGIKGLKIDEARLMDFLKDIKFKDEPSPDAKSYQAPSIKSEHFRPVKTPKMDLNNDVSYYDTWYSIIESELKNIKS